MHAISAVLVSSVGSAELTSSDQTHRLFFDCMFTYVNYNFFFIRYIIPLDYINLLQNTFHHQYYNYSMVLMYY